MAALQKRKTAAVRACPDTDGFPSGVFSDFIFRKGLFFMHMGADKPMHSLMEEFYVRLEGIWPSA
jgi:hypothetical protein